MSDYQDRVGLYLISPPEFELDAFVEKFKEALSGGDVASFQLRMKPASADAIKKAANALMPIAHAHDVVFILNDDPALAKELGADGVHLGADDISVDEARGILGDAAIIGASCYDSRHRAMEAAEAGADYVAFGAFFPTTSKAARGKPAPEILKWWSTYTVIPCVAIGGINHDNCRELIKNGADFLAAISAIWDHPKGPAESVKKFNAAIESCKAKE